MAIAIRRKQQNITSARRFGSEADVEAITGISRRTLQKDRVFGRGLKFYKFGRKVLYDLNEVDQYIRGAATSENRGRRTHATQNLSSSRRRK